MKFSILSMRIHASRRRGGPVFSKLKKDKTGDWDRNPMLCKGFVKVNPRGLSWLETSSALIKDKVTPIMSQKLSEPFSLIKCVPKSKELSL